MSFNQPPPQPGYGGQPGQPQQPPVPPGPPQQPGPGYGYPQQPTAPQPGAGYGYPQQPGPYGQQPGPYGRQPGAWGAPPPPRSGGKGKVIGILVGLVVAVALIGGGIVFFMSSSGGGGDYKLTTPATVVDGTYSNSSQKLAESESGSDQYISNGTSISAAYTSGGEQIGFGGAYGGIDDPGAAVDKMISAALAGSAASEQHPAGFDGDVMKCGEKDYGVFKSPFCVWGDDSTVALLIWSPSPEATGSGTIPDAPSVADFAETTAKFRNDVRVKK
ncbi:hypothetical protein ACFZAU_13505 [Streptomyces sp. NPDC008238]